MIFNVAGHIEMIRNGLYQIFTDHKGDPTIIVKTQSRRPNRGVYQIESKRKKPHKIGYAVQRKRGVKAEPDIRILFDRIWEESIFGSSQKVAKPHFLFISKEDAQAEGGYTPEDYEWTYRKLNPKWQQARWSRWAFEFHVIEVRV